MIMMINKFIKLPAMQYAVNFFIAFFAFMVCRVIFIAANQDFYSEIEFGHYMTLFRGGMKYDFAAIFYLTAASFAMMILPFRFTFNDTYRKVAKYLFVIPIAVGIFANIFDAIYFPYNARRTNFSFFSEFQNESNLLGIFFGGLLQYWYMTLAAAVLIFLAVKFYYNPKVSAEDYHGKRFSLKVLPLTLLFIYFMMAGMRGSLIIDEDHRPMRSDEHTSELQSH